MGEAQILEIVDIFTDLSPDQLKLIYEICTEKACTLGTVLVKENTPSTEVYIILEGSVEVVVGFGGINRDKEKRIAVLERGQSFGEIALVDQGLRSATVRCISKTCRLLEISREDLMNLLRTNPDIGFIVMHNLAADLCLKIRQATYRVY